MSLVAFAIRISTVRAIRAAVWPGVVVADSPQAPLDLLEIGKPLIAVYTGNDTNRLEGDELFSGDPRVSLAIQVFLPTQLSIATGSGQVLTFDTRQEGAETVLDVIERRILGALAGQFEPWAAMRACFVDTVPRLDSVSYLVETAGAVRTSAREITLDCGVAYEPIPGAPPEGRWADLIALMRTDTGLRGAAHLADWLAAEIEGPQLLTQDERDRIDLGLTAYAATQSSILPIVRGSEVPPSEIDVSRDADTLVVDAGP